MKTIEQVLQECPKHDCAYVLYNGRWHRIEEHELRAIQVAVCCGSVEPPRIKLNNGEQWEWSKELPGRSENKLHSNILRLNGEQAMWLNRMEILNRELDNNLNQL